MNQSVLETAGAHADRIAWLFWVHLAVLGAVYGLLVVALAVGLARRAAPADERKRHAVTGATAVTGLILLGFLLVNVIAGKQLGAASRVSATTRVIRVTGHQWWWEVHYPGASPADEVADANELHLPAGEPVLLELRSADVIHSLWIPSLQGKRDLVPGRLNTLTIRAERPGLYRGQCAEFCGTQHANMALDVVVEPPGELDTWLARAHRPAPEPTSELARRGKEIFVSGPCHLCHNIAGTEASASAGPDLSHLAARLELAAGALPNVRRHLAAWIRDPQTPKAGAAMPAVPLDDRDLEALLAYLEVLR